MPAAKESDIVSLLCDLDDFGRPESETFLFRIDEFVRRILKQCNNNNYNILIYKAQLRGNS